MTMNPYEILSAMLLAQRQSIFELVESGLTEAQWNILRKVSQNNHEIADFVGVYVPSMTEVGKRHREVNILESWLKLESKQHEKETATGSAFRLGNDEIGSQAEG